MKDKKRERQKERRNDKKAEREKDRVIRRQKGCVVIGNDEWHYHWGFENELQPILPSTLSISDVHTSNEYITTWWLWNTHP